MASALSLLFKDMQTPVKTAGSSATLKKPIVQSKPVVKPKAPVTTKTTSGGGGGGGGSSQGITNQPQQTSSNDYNPDAERDRQAEEERKRREEFERKEREAINAEFEPVFQELDRRVGLLPEQRKEFEAQLTSSAASQKEGAEASRVREQAGLDASKQNEYDTSKSAFRDLESDIRNSLLAKAFYFGAAGAGDSSATGMASEAITRGGLKARGSILNARNKALSVIDQKKAEVESLATEQVKKIDQWKSDKLFETAQFFSNKLDELQGQKVQAGTEKAKAISNLIRGLNQDFLARLRQLDDQVSSYKQSVSTWQMQRAAEMEDYGKKLAMSASYSSASPQQYKIVKDEFGRVYGVNPYNPSDIVETPIGQLSSGEEQGGLGGFLSNLFGGKKREPEVIGESDTL